MAHFFNHKGSMLDNQKVDTKPAKQEIARTKQGRFVKGASSPNPKGCGIHSIKLNALFTKAFLDDKEKHKGSDLFQLAFKVARTDTKVLCVLLNKFVPDLIKGEGFDSNNITQIYSGLATGDLRCFVEGLRKRVSQARPV